METCVVCNKQVPWKNSFYCKKCKNYKCGDCYFSIFERTDEDVCIDCAKNKQKRQNRRLNQYENDVTSFFD